MCRSPDCHPKTDSILRSKDELERFIGVSKRTPNDLQDETIGTFFVGTYKKLTKRMGPGIDGNAIFLMGYAQSIFQDIQKYLKTAVRLLEGDLQVI